MAKPLNDLEFLIENGDEKDIQNFFNLLQGEERLELIRQLRPEQWIRVYGFFHPSEQASILREQPPEVIEKILKSLDEDQLSDLLPELDEHTREKVLNFISTPRLRSAISEMETDDAADIIAELPNAVADELLQKLPKEDSEPIRQLLKYPKDTAGGLMQTELIKVHKDATAREAIEEIRNQYQKHEGDIDIYEVFVVDDDGKLIGHFSLDKLVISPPDTPVSQLMEEELYYVPVDMDQEKVAEYFKRYNLVSLPVVDEKRRLVGRITSDDIMDVLEEEASEDIFQMAGVAGDDVVYDKVIRSAFLRLPWLITNLFGGMLTGYFIWIFKGPLSEKLIVSLIPFVPVITGMGGNVGTQSSSITVRGFAIGRIDPNNYFPYLFKEFRVGALMGLTCGVALALIGWLWHGNPALGLVVGTSLFLAMTVASTMGVFVPVIFARLNIDPALASGPFVTTSNDITGIIIYFSTAVLFKNFLLQ